MRGTNLAEPSNSSFLLHAGYWLIGGSAIHAIIQSSSLGSGKSPVQSIFFGLFMALVDSASRYRKAEWRAMVDPVHPLGSGVMGLAVLVFAMLKRPTDIGPFALWEWAFILAFGAIPGFLAVAGGIELRRRMRASREG